MWSKDALHYGCKRGHVMAKNAVIPPAGLPDIATHEVVPVRRWWERWPYALTAVGAVLGFGISELLEVLL